MWRVGVNFGPEEPLGFPDGYVHQYEGNGNYYVYVNQLGEFGPFAQPPLEYPSTHIPAVPPSGGIWPHVVR
ncbi:MAG: hypothetical protein D6732_10170 [Methanobacteriota archaeon]|nr:MAG: hypothetical protein D6732_10170 [Euryarchaeota archaeon]